jgi:hypothetical protein
VTVHAQIPLPAFNRTFSSPTLSRGFYFQTPVAIVVTGLRVPDEFKHGLQNVEVFRMTAAPPAYPATATGTQVFYMTGVPSNTVIPTAILFQANEWVGVLGTCGDASNMHNSYGPVGPFQSNVLGNPITLTRFLTQTNLVSSGGNQPYSSEAAFEVSRVQVFVAGQASAIDYGAGAGIGANPAPTLTTTAGPILGNTATLTVGQSHTVNQGALMVLGLGRASIPILQGTLLVNPSRFLLIFPMPGPLGAATPMNFPIPNQPSLINAPALNFQAFVLVLPDVAMTNGMEWAIGF